MIGHMKADGRLGRNYLLGAAGDAINALLVAAGHNLRLILNWLRLFVAWLLAAPCAVRNASCSIGEDDPACSVGWDIGSGGDREPAVGIGRHG
jgi:IS5 family transposase